MALSLATAEGEEKSSDRDGRRSLGAAESKWERSGGSEAKLGDLRRHAAEEKWLEEEGQRRDPSPAALTELFEARRRKSFQEHSLSETRSAEEERGREVAILAARDRISADKERFETKLSSNDLKSSSPLKPLPIAISPAVRELSDRVEDVLEDSKRHIDSAKELTSSLKGHVDSMEIERRAAYMREQQRAIVAQKRKEREARMAHSKEQPRNQDSMGERDASAQESKHEEAKDAETSRRRAVMSMALASRLKEELSASDAGRLQKNQMSDLNRKIHQLEQSRQRSEQREKTLAAYLNRRL